MSQILGRIVVENTESGGGGGTTLLVNTPADLNNIAEPTEGQLVGVLETNTLWQYSAGTWSDTTVSISNQYGGQVADTKKEVIFQRYLTDNQLISLFGVVSDGTITVNQSAVNYSLLGAYPVTFTFSKGRPITVTIVVVDKYTFDLETIKKNTKTITNATNFVDQYSLGLNFATYTLSLNGATSPVVVGNRHEWSKRPLADIQKVSINFTNLASLSNGRTLNCTVTFVNYDLYPYVNSNQKWGFDVVGGKLIFLQSGFSTMEAKFEFSDNLGNILYLNVATRVDNVHYAKVVGSESGTEFFVSPDSLLLGENYYPNKAELPVFIGYRFEGDGDTLDADNIALGIVKQATSSFTIIYGKNYTGSVDFDYSTANYEELPFTMRGEELVTKSSLNVDRVTKSTTTPNAIAEGGTLVLLTIPAGILKADKVYRMAANAKYTRTSGGSTPSNIGFKILQGIAQPYIDDLIVVARDANSVILNIPSIMKRFTFNETDTVVIEAYVPAGQQPVTITEASIEFIEVNEFNR